MCEIVTYHMTQRRQKREKVVKSSGKRERVAELEKQVQQLTSIIDKACTIDSAKEGNRSGEYSMAEQVSTIEQKMQRLNHNISQSTERGSTSTTENEMLRAQVRTL